ncbi:MAG: YiiX/YebB-like N1pC/P60 family cysteine hydrolase, partial [Bacteriovoracia bacterium]
LGSPEEWGSWPVLHEGKRIPLIAHPLVLKLLPQLEEQRFVVEALRIPGVTMNSLEAFMDVDDLLILRAERIADPGELILSTLKQVGKPYDFNFDVETQREIVCSELAYVVFTDEDWPTERSLGRYTIGPDQVAWKVFDNRFDVVRLYHDGKLLTDGAREKLYELIDAPGGIAPFMH